MSRLIESLLLRASAAENAAMQTGKLQRTDPLPEGRYWIDTFGPPGWSMIDPSTWDFTGIDILDPSTWTGSAVEKDNRLYFAAWLAANHDKVNVIATESWDNEDPPRQWTLFQVVIPAPWPEVTAKRLGYPSTASDKVESSQDTESVGEDNKWCGPGGMLEAVCKGSDDDPEWQPSWLPWAVGGGAALVGGLVIWRVTRRR